MGLYQPGSQSSVQFPNTSFWGLFFFSLLISDLDGGLEDILSKLQIILDWEELPTPLRGREAERF